MGMTMTEKILAQHAGRDAVQAGDLLVAQVNLKKSDVLFLIRIRSR